MLERSKLEDIAEFIRDNIALSGIDQYCQEVGASKDNFIEIEPQEFEGSIMAIDGSNVRICDWSVANLNQICAGYAVYKGSEWQRTVITYDDAFLADKERYADQFEPHFRDIFEPDELDKLETFSLEDTELDRLSTYFRELQEYIALIDAIDYAKPGDLVLYDGGFIVYEPLRSVLEKVIERSEEKEVDLLGISKSSAISWGDGVSRPFVQHTSYAGSIFMPGLPWYLSLKGKKVKPQPNWEGETCIVRFNGHSDQAFRVDLPRYLANRISSVLGKLVMHSCSAECLGYPHALFKAHRDIRITEQEGYFKKLKLMDLLSTMGLTESQIRNLMLDFHEVIEMKSRI